MSDDEKEHYVKTTTDKGNKRLGLQICIMMLELRDIWVGW